VFTSENNLLISFVSITGNDTLSTLLGTLTNDDEFSCNKVKKYVNFSNA
jgi:hypothetical protein